MIENVICDDKNKGEIADIPIGRSILPLYFLSYFFKKKTASTTEKTECCDECLWGSLFEIKELVKRDEHDLAKKASLEIDTSVPFFKGLSRKDIEQLLFSLRHSDITGNKDFHNLSAFLQQGGTCMSNMVNEILKEVNHYAFSEQFLFLYEKTIPDLTRREKIRTGDKTIVFYFRHYSDVKDSHYKESSEPSWQGCDLILSALMILLLDRYVEIESEKYTSVKIISRVPYNFPNWVLKLCKNTEYCNVSGESFDTLQNSQDTSVIYPSSGSLGDNNSIHARGLVFHNQPSHYKSIPFRILWPSGEDRSFINFPYDKVDYSNDIYAMQREILNVARRMEANL